MCQCITLNLAWVRLSIIRLIAGGIDEKTTVREEGRVLDGPGQVLDHVVLLRSVEEDQLAQGLEIGERDEMRTSRA